MPSHRTVSLGIGMIGGKMNRKQAVLVSFLSFVGLAMIAGGVAIVFPMGRVGDHIFGSLTLIGFYALGIMLVMTFSHRMPWTRRGCVIACLISLVFFLVGIWFQQAMSWRWENRIFVSGAIALTIGGMFVHRLFIWPIKPRQLSSIVLRWLAILFSFAFAGVLLYGFFAHGFRNWGTIHVRTMGITAVLGAGTTIATIAVAMFGHKPGENEPGAIRAAIQVSMTCPRCDSQIEARSNQESRCDSCRLKIRVEVEEPRCGCGYLLYQLESDTCPECGKLIAEDDRWAGQDRG